MLQRRCKTQRPACYRPEELTALTGLKSRAVLDGLRELRKHSLLEFTTESVNILDHKSADGEDLPFDTDPNRIVPVPRRLIRVLCAHGKKSEIVIALIHCARGLFKVGSRIVMKGAVKASWITDVFGFGKTVVHSTRAWLRSLGFINEQKGVEQWRKNRWGYYFEIRCGYLPRRRKRNTTQNALSGGPLKRNPFNKLKSINQYQNPSQGSAHRISTRASGSLKGISAAPTIKNIQAEDLRRLSRLLMLHQQAVNAGWIGTGEANLQNFVAAAIRSTRVVGDSVRIFVGIVRKGLWHHITGEQESRATQALKNYRERHKQKPGGDQIERNRAKIAALISELSSESKGTAASLLAERRLITQNRSRI